MGKEGGCLRSLYCAPLLHPKPKGEAMDRFYPKKLARRKKCNLYRIPIATKGIINAYNHWLSTFAKPKKWRHYSRSSKWVNQSISRGYETHVRDIVSPTLNSQKMLLHCIERQQSAKVRIDVKPFTPSLWARVVENSINYVNSLKSISEMLFPSKDFECDADDSLLDFDWGSYLLFLFNLTTSVETIRQLLDNGDSIVSHHKGNITGIVGLDKSEWSKLFNQIETVIEIAQNLEDLVVRAHGLPLECIINLFPPQPDLDWDVFFDKSDRLNLSAKTVLNFLYSIFFVDDSCIKTKSDLRETGFGICEEISKRYSDQSFETNFNCSKSNGINPGNSSQTGTTSDSHGINSIASAAQCFCLKTEKKSRNQANTKKLSSLSAVQPIFLNQLKENRSKARVEWIRSKYNIIEQKNKAKKGILQNTSDIQNSIEYLTKLRLLSEPENTSNKHILTPGGRRNFFRRHTSHINIREAKRYVPHFNATCEYTDAGITALVPLHRYVSYFVLNLSEPQRDSSLFLTNKSEPNFRTDASNHIRQPSVFSKDSNGSILHPRIRRLSNKLNVIKNMSELSKKSGLKSNSEAVFNEKSKIFENPVPERRSVMMKRVKNEPLLFQDMRKIGQRERDKNSVGYEPSKATIFMNSTEAEAEGSSTPRQSDIPIKKSTPNTDLKSAESRNKHKDQITNWCIIQNEKENELVVPPNYLKLDNAPSNMLGKIEDFLKTGLRQNKLLRVLEEMHVPVCHCHKFYDGQDPLISVLMDWDRPRFSHSRLKDYNVVMIKTFRFLYPTALITKGDDNTFDFGAQTDDHLSSHLISFSDEDASLPEKEIFTSILTLAQKRFTEAHREAQKKASLDSSGVLNAQ